MSGARPVYVTAAAIGIAALLFGLFVPVDGAPWIPCGFLAITGYPCPFCGTTRAFLAAGHGAWRAAWLESPLGAVLFPAAGLLLVWSVWRLARGGSERLHLPRSAWWIAAVAVAANWIYRLVNGLR